MVKHTATARDLRNLVAYTIGILYNISSDKKKFDFKQSEVVNKLVEILQTDYLRYMFEKRFKYTREEIRELRVYLEVAYSLRYASVSKALDRFDGNGIFSTAEDRIKEKTFYLTEGLKEQIEKAGYIGSRDVMNIKYQKEKDNLNIDKKIST